MAVSWVAVQQTEFTFQSPMHIPIPGTVQTDDVLMVTAFGDVVTSVTDNDGGTWAKIGETADTVAALWWRRATSATASKTITLSGSLSSAFARCDVYRGCLASGNPYEAFSGEVNSTFDESHANITTTVAGAMICWSLANGSGNNVTNPVATDPATLTMQTLTLNDDGIQVFHASNLRSTAGGTGALTWTMADSPSWSIMWALKPAAGGDPAPIRAILKGGL